MPSEQAVHVWKEHTDYVRCGALSEETPLLFSGSYDHSVKGWDPRAPSGSAALSWDLGAPVEAMRLLPGSSLLAVAAGQKVKLFDLLRGGNAAPLVTWSNYSKTVTSLDVVENAGQTAGQRVLLTGSLDHHVKGYSLETFKVVYSHKYTAPILSLGMSPNGQTLAVGMANGLLALSPRRIPKDPNSEKKTRLAAQEKLRRGSLAYFSRGSSYAGQGEDALLLSPNKKRKLAEYNRLLKSFQYGAALDAVLGKVILFCFGYSLTDISHTKK